MAAILVKICLLLNLKADCEKYMDEFEETSQELEDPFQSALAMRWRLDFDDWRLNTFAVISSHFRTKILRCLYKGRKYQ